MAEYIDAQELVKRLGSETPPLLIDVRIGQIGQIPGATHIPILDLEDRPEPVQPDRDVVVFCQFGKGASEYAAEVLEEQGWTRVYKLRGGMDGWVQYMASLK